jgi:integrase
VRASLSTFFGWIIREGLMGPNPANPVTFTNKRGESSRDRVLTPAELRAAWNALPQGDFADIVKLLMLTAQRREEMGALRWSEITNELDAIDLPAERTKNHREHHVPLPAAAQAILAARPRWAGRDLVFGRGDGGYSGWSNCKERLDAAITEAAGKKAPPMPAWRLHDLRRSAATYMGGGLPKKQLDKLPMQDRKLAEGLGVQPHIIEEVLNHISGHRAGVAGTYNRGIYEQEKRTALARWAERLVAIVEDRSDNVVPLARA